MIYKNARVESGSGPQRFGGQHNLKLGGLFAVNNCIHLDSWPDALILVSNNTRHASPWKRTLVGYFFLGAEK